MKKPPSGGFFMHMRNQNQDIETTVIYQINSSLYPVPITYFLFLVSYFLFLISVTPLHQSHELHHYLLSGQ
jgi:hypothetical protein